MSLQQDRYLSARRQGRTMHTACVESGISIEEARLIEAAVSRGELSYDLHKNPAVQEIALSHSTPSQEERMPKHDTIMAEPAGDDPLVELTAETLRGDIRDSVLAWFKAQPKAWPFMAEREQRDLADAIDVFAYALVKKAAQIIAAGERPTIVAKLVEYKEKDGVEAKLKLASTGEIVASLHEACGQEVLLVATGATDFNGEAGEAAIDRDQPGLRGIGDEYEGQ